MAEAALAQDQLFALRNTIARIEGVPTTLEDRNRSGKTSSSCLPLGCEPCDQALGGGVQLDALNEIRTGETRDAGAATGFVLGLCVMALKVAGRAAQNVLWIGETVASMEAGLPNAEGLLGFGLHPSQLVYARPHKLEDALFMAETALGVSAFAAVILEVRGNPQKFGLTESRRLHLRARAAGRPLFLLRQAGEEEASSAPLRLSVTPAPARARPLPDGSALKGSIGNPVFRVTLEKSRNPGTLEFTMEWNAHDRQFYPAAQSFTRSLPQPEPAYSGAQLSASGHRPDRPQAMGNVVAFSRAS